MQPPATSTIKLSLRELAHLFNAMDSSPYVDRDLAADAEEFIVSSARELPPGDQLELVIGLPFGSITPGFAGIEEAVRRYFSSRRDLKRLEFRQLMRRGRLSLGVGLLFLIICLLLGELVGKSHLGAAADIMREGLTIGGWVAMWRPLEICLYDWWPLYEDRRRLDRLAQIRVRLIPQAVLAASSLFPNSPETGPVGTATAA